MNPFQIIQLVVQLIAIAPQIGESLAKFMEAIQRKGDATPEQVTKTFQQALMSPGLPMSAEEWEQCLDAEPGGPVQP